MTLDRTRLFHEGFIADEIADVIAVVRNDYDPQLTELRGLNRLLTQSQYELAVHPESAQETCCAALYIRAIAHCQAVLILLERGMVHSARAMIRCALEALFNLGACAADHKTALSFLDADQVDRRRRARYLAQVQDPTAKARLDIAELQEILQEIERKIDEVEARDLRPREMAKRAGLEDLYLTAYAQLSGAVHSTVGDLDRHFRTSPEGNVLELLTEPIVAGLGGEFLVLGETMGGLVHAVARVFPLNIVAACDAHVARLHEIHSSRAG